MLREITIGWLSSEIGALEVKMGGGKLATLWADYNLGSVFMSKLNHPELVTRAGKAGSTSVWC